jgi:hypothetical protein
MECSAAYSLWSRPTFQRCVLPASERWLITLMMEAVRNSEPSVYSKETTQRYIPEGSNIYTRLRENLKSRIKQITSEQYKLWCNVFAAINIRYKRSGTADIPIRTFHKCKLVNKSTGKRSLVNLQAATSYLAPHTTIMMMMVMVTVIIFRFIKISLNYTFIRVAIQTEATCKHVVTT